MYSKNKIHSIIIECLTIPAEPRIWPTWQNHDDVIIWKHIPRYWPFVRGIPCHRWIPLAKASDVELWCFLWSAPEQTVNKQSRRRWFEEPLRSLWRHWLRRNSVWIFILSSHGVVKHSKLQSRFDQCLLLNEDSSSDSLLFLFSATIPHVLYICLKIYLFVPYVTQSSHHWI